MAQKLLLFWRKPARRCWWEGVELENVPGVEGKLKVWIRRVWTLEMVCTLSLSPSLSLSDDFPERHWATIVALSALLNPVTHRLIYWLLQDIPSIQREFFFLVFVVALSSGQEWRRIICSLWKCSLLVYLFWLYTYFYVSSNALATERGSSSTTMDLNEIIT